MRAVIRANRVDSVVVALHTRMKKLLVCALPLVLAACASAPPPPPTPVYTFYDAQAANARILELAGNTAPAGVELAPAYLERWIKSSAKGGKWTCTGSYELRGKTMLTITRLDGNRFRGVWASADECGYASNYEVEGRYDDRYVYLHLAAEPKLTRTSAIKRFEVAGAGRTLIEDENYSFKDGQPYRYVYPRTGNARGNDIYYTSDFRPDATETPGELLAQASAALAVTKAQAKRRDKGSSFNWAGFAAGMAGIVADASAQQQRAIANNEQRRLALEAKLQQERAAQAREQAAALARLQAKRQAQQQARQQPPAQPAPQRAAIDSRQALAAPQPSQPATPAAKPESLQPAQTEPRAPSTAVAATVTPVASTVVAAPAAAPAGEAATRGRPVYVYCQAYAPGRAKGGGPQWLMTPIGTVHRHGTAAETAKLDNAFRTYVTQRIGANHNTSCNGTFDAGETTQVRDRAIQNFEKSIKSGGKGEIVHLTWTPSD